MSSSTWWNVLAPSFNQNGYELFRGLITLTDPTVISEYCTVQGNCRQLIESNCADSAVPVRKQTTVPSPNFTEPPPPFISFYHSLTPHPLLFTTTIPSDKVRFTETLVLCRLQGWNIRTAVRLCQ